MAKRIARLYNVELEVYHTDNSGRSYVRIYFNDPQNLKDFFVHLSEHPEIDLEIQKSEKTDSGKMHEYVV
jgi:hypothetical protein